MDFRNIGYEEDTKWILLVCIKSHGGLYNLYASILFAFMANTIFYHLLQTFKIQFSLSLH
jgi:hypothetical protein